MAYQSPSTVGSAAPPWEDVVPELPESKRNASPFSIFQTEPLRIGPPESRLAAS
jgi:hypothetical protein